MLKILNKLKGTYSYKTPSVWFRSQQGISKDLKPGADKHDVNGH